MTRRRPVLNPLVRWLHNKGYTPLSIAKIIRYAGEEWTLAGIEPGLIDPAHAAEAEDILADSQPKADFTEADWGSPIGEAGSLWNGLDDRWKAGPDPALT